MDMFNIITVILGLSLSGIQIIPIIKSAKQRNEFAPPYYSTKY